MKAAVFYGIGDLRVEERPMPKAGPGQMVVKIDYCGVCGTDVEACRISILQVQSKNSRSLLRWPYVTACFAARVPTVYMAVGLPELCRPLSLTICWMASRRLLKRVWEKDPAMC